jgi:hypothetical protein
MTGRILESQINGFIYVLPAAMKELAKKEVNG